MKTLIAVSKVSQSGTITIPSYVRLKLRANNGDKIVWFEDENEDILVSKLKDIKF